ncbi:hypothetical protein L195_g051774 [Trifolium pratense]|uniref:Uncharacterized protein n=1 Tax=Trifolium pratense TaxID=57577 RepID=A0A2K3K1M2_TRIPR|nr:hypothetical protein L195_g051774 [Trifolium pratense]
MNQLSDRDSAFRFENIGKGSGFQLIRKGSSSQAKIRLPVFNAIGRQATKGKIRQGFELAFQILQASGKGHQHSSCRVENTPSLMTFLLDFPSRSKAVQAKTLEDTASRNGRKRKG